MAVGGWCNIYRIAHCCDQDSYIVQDLLGADVPIISVSKGLESGTGRMMSELIPEVMGRKHPTAFLSGPSFAKEVMDLRPTGVVAASRVSAEHVLTYAYNLSVQILQKLVIRDHQDSNLGGFPQ